MEEKIRNLIEGVIVDAGYTLNGVKVSELINPILDKTDPIEGSYVLDVSSVERG